VIAARSLALAVAFVAGIAGAQTAARQAQQKAALLRFEEALHKEVALKRGTPAVSWREALVRPDADRLLWGERPTRVPGAMPLYRAGFDPRTRWYYVARTVGGRVQYFGPLEEIGGDYVDVFPEPPEPPASR
jgi:hypothetical protein